MHIILILGSGTGKYRINVKFQGEFLQFHKVYNAMKFNTHLFQDTIVYSFIRSWSSGT